MYLKSSQITIPTRVLIIIRCKRCFVCRLYCLTLTQFHAVSKIPHETPKSKLYLCVFLLEYEKLCKAVVKPIRQNTFECTLHLPSCDDHGVWRPSYCLTLYRKHSETIKGGLKALSARMGLKSVLADSYGLKYYSTISFFILPSPYLTMLIPLVGLANRCPSKEYRETSFVSL